MIKHLYFFGDSICVGQGVSIHRGWVTRISERVSLKYNKPDSQIIVINAAVNGSTTRQALERMPYEVQSHSPDVLLIQFGMNDCNIWETDKGHPRVSPKAFAANLEEIIARARIFGAQRVILNTNHPTGLDQDLMPNAKVTYQEQNEQYNQIICKIAKAFGDYVVINDIESAFRETTAGDRKRLLTFLLSDLLHLSEAGHDLYFSIVWPAIDKVLSELP